VDIILLKYAAQVILLDFISLIFYDVLPNLDLLPTQIYGIIHHSFPQRHIL
jgi:hypothetical protein